MACTPNMAGALARGAARCARLGSLPPRRRRPLLRAALAVSTLKWKAAPSSNGRRPPSRSGMHASLMRHTP
eukprot:4619360-Prymnesium_polylepis.1